MKVIQNKWIPFKGYKYINLFGLIFTRDASKINAKEYNHEKIHLKQMQEMLWLPFYLWYGVEYCIIRLLRFFDKQDVVYHDVSFEEEAYNNENNYAYPETRKHYEQKSYSDMPLSLVEEINDQRNRTYDLMQEPYARERAKAVDHQYGTDYLKVYDSMLEKYVDIDEYFQLPEPKYKKMERPTIGAQVTPSEGNTMYFNRDMIKTPEDIPNSVVLHEMGHLVDGAAGMNNEFLRKLGDKSKFIPYNQAKTMYPNMTRDMYNNILQGTEIKSYMNQFRNYLDQKGKLNRGNYTGSYKNLKKEIIDAPRESFNNIKAIFNLYRSPKLFNKDFQMIPIVNNNDNNTIA